MEIKTVSVAVPAKCPNNCKFCISRARDNEYQIPSTDDYIKRLNKRLEFAKENGYNKIIITSTGEPLTNRSFFNDLSLYDWMDKMKWVEVQTSGVHLTETYIPFLKDKGISTISLSVADIWDNDNNLEIINPRDDIFKYDVENLCKSIKNEDLILRLSIPMTDILNNKEPEDIFERCDELGADQLVLRNLQHPENKDTDQYVWIWEHKIDRGKKIELKDYINRGSLIYEFDYDQQIVEVDGIATMIDRDCTGSKFSNKYFIIREDGRAYHRWDKPSSIIF